MAKYLTEFLGTFFLVLTIGLSSLRGSPMAPFAIGLGLMALVYMGGHVSGAHYNPAVSLSFLIRGRMDARDLVPYWMAQLVGAGAAALTVWIVTGGTYAPVPGAEASTIGALLVEVLFTFALVLVILHVATTKATEGNAYYGLAIGVVIAAAAFAGGPISGGAFNPAVGLGPTVIAAVLGNGTWDSLWLYLVGPFTGAAAAVWVFTLQGVE